MNTDNVIAICISVLVLLCAGTPDIVDAIVAMLMK